MFMDNELITIGKVATETGCNIETIRYYEKENLLEKPERSAGGHRLYSRESVQRLFFVRRSRELGFSMNEIRQLLSLVDRQGVSCKVVKDIANKHIEDIHSKLIDLRKMERTLKAMASRCSGKNVPECPIIEDLKRRGERD